MRVVSFLLAAALVLAAGPGAGQEKAAPAKLNPQFQPVVVELRSASVEVSFIESEYGMRILLRSGGVQVEGRRVHIGDGKVAVMFQADNNGWDSPDGRVNRAAVTYDKGATLRVPAERAKTWSAVNGEIYVLTPGLTFEVVGKK